MLQVSPTVLFGINYWLHKRSIHVGLLPPTLQRLLGVEAPLPIYQTIRPGKTWATVQARWIQEAILAGDVVRLLDLLTNGANPNTGTSPKTCPLTDAAIANQVLLIDILMRHGANPNHLYPMHRAAAEGKLQSVKAFIENWHVMVDQLDAEGRSALFWAASYNRVEVISYLLDHGAEINRSTTDKGECTILIAAAEADHIEAVQLLLSRGADPNLPAVNGWSPLFQASKCNSVKTIRALLRTGRVNINQTVSEYKLTAVAAAIDKGHIDTLKVLISLGADVRTPLLRSQICPLRQTIDAKRLDMVTVLLEAGVDPNVSSGKYTALKLAAEQANIELVRLLMRYGACPRIRCETDRSTALYVAAALGHKEVLSSLLFEHQPHSRLCTTASLSRDNGSVTVYTPIIGCLVCSDETVGIAMARTLVAAGASVNDRVGEVNRTNALWYAVKEQKNRLARVMLLEFGANPNSVSIASALSTLALACKSQRVDIELVKLLIQCGALVNYVLPAKFDTTLLNQVTITGNLEVVRILVRAGADLYRLADNKRSCLHLAALLGFPEIVKFYLEEGMPPDYSGSSSPLISAAVKGRTAIVQTLLQCGANINLERDGWTPLIAAVRGDQLETVKFLLANGAHPLVRTNDGMDAIKWAQKLGFGQIANVLRKSH